MRKRLLRLIYFGLFAVGFAMQAEASATINRCEHLFNLPAVSTARANQSTLNLIARLNALVDEHILTINELKTFTDRLAADATVVNPLGPQSATNNSTRYIHRQSLDVLIAAEDIQKELILQWAQAKLAHLGLIQSARRDASNDTRRTLPSLAIEFFPIQTGEFQFIGNLTGTFFNKNPRTMKIDYRFQVSSTPITEFQWSDVMGDIPKVDDAASIPAHPFRDARERPVRNISWLSAAVFANELSKRHNLKPFYNLDGLDVFLSMEHYEQRSSPVKINKKNSSQVFAAAAAGTLIAMNQSSFPKPKSPSSEYGYRLITQLEFQYLLNRSKQNYIDPFNAMDVIMRFSWGKGVGAKWVNFVASMEPAIVDGYSIYDLLGNVRTWTNDLLLGHAQNAPSTINVGVSYDELAHNYEWGARSLGTLWETSDSVGLRLVRTLPKD